MHTYVRKVQYHETDKMGITHHSNYIKWMEEARIDLLDQIGCNYARMEADGVISPVTGVSCSYKSPSTFGDEISVCVQLRDYTGVRFSVDYEMRSTADGRLIARCSSDHCFINAAGRPVSLRRQFPEYDNLFKQLM